MLSSDLVSCLLRQHEHMREKRRGKYTAAAITYIKYTKSLHEHRYYTIFRGKTEKRRNMYTCRDVSEVTALLNNLFRGKLQPLRVSVLIKGLNISQFLKGDCVTKASHDCFLLYSFLFS